MSEERFRGDPRPRSRRPIVIVGGLLLILVAVGFVVAARQPTYLPPPGDQIDILLELAGVFPDKYGIMWREHGILRSTDPVSMQDPSLLRGAQFMHNLTTGARTDGKVYVEVAYRFYGADHDVDESRKTAPTLGPLAADKGTMTCACAMPDSAMDCSGLLGFGNYEFSLEVAYTTQQCPNGPDPKLVEEFRHSLQTADRLIALYLKPLRRKAGWL
jgi:hypothetical protein